jgi:large subunit ribosomal protein L35
VPKMKTHKATAKRFKMTSSGGIRRLKIGKSHLRRKKAARVARSFDKAIDVEGLGAAKRVRRLLPYIAKRGR